MTYYNRNKKQCPYWKPQLLSFDDYSCTKPSDNILDEVITKMKTDLAFCEEHAEKDFGLPASAYYNSRAGCLGYYLEWIEARRKPK